MVDWSQPLYLVEGIFDEIAIGSQAICLYGKFIQKQLINKLVSNKAPIVYICLDNDAKNEAIQIAKKLIEYDIKCSIVELDGKDPSAIGRDAVMGALQKSKMIEKQIDIIGLGVH